MICFESLYAEAGFPRSRRASDTALFEDMLLLHSEGGTVAGCTLNGLPPDRSISASSAMLLCQRACLLLLLCDVKLLAY